jgi:hypothetical protein
MVGIALLEGGLEGRPESERGNRKKGGAQQKELAHAVVEQAVSWIKLAATSGYFPAQSMLGLMYKRGGAAVDMDLEKAVMSSVFGQMVAVQGCTVLLSHTSPTPTTGLKPSMRVM